MMNDLTMKFWSYFSNLEIDINEFENKYVFKYDC